MNSAAAPTLPQGAQEVVLKPTDDEKPYLSKAVVKPARAHAYAFLCHFLQGGTTFVSLKVARKTVFFPLFPSHKVVL